MDTTFGLAAVALVMAARYQPAFLFHPAGALDAALLLFAAGLAAPARRPGRDLAALAALAWGGTLVASLLGLALAAAGLSPGGPLPAPYGAAGILTMLRDVALAPLGAAPAPALLQAGWILAAAALGRAVLLVAPGVPGAATLVALAGVALLALGGERGGGPGPGLVALRCAFGIAFVALGRLVREAGEPSPRRLRAPAFVALAFVAVDVVAVNAGGLGYRPDGDPGAPGALAGLATTALLVLMAAAVASGAAEIVGPRSALLATGRAWRWIVAGHAAVLFAVDAAFALAGRVPRAEVARAPALLDMNRLWLLYLVPAIGLPALAALAAARLRRAPAGEG